MDNSSASSWYTRIGGDTPLRQTVTAFYDSVLTDPLLQPLFGGGQPHHIDHLTAFLAEVFGGPTRFTDELGGFDTILKAHQGLAITDAQRARFIQLFLTAADQSGLTSHDPFRQALVAYLDFGTEVAQVNSHAVDDASLHPCQEVPRWT